MRAPREFQISHQHVGGALEEGKSGGDGGKIEGKLSEVSTRAVSRGQQYSIFKIQFSTCNSHTYR